MNEKEVLSEIEEDSSDEFRKFLKDYVKETININQQYSKLIEEYVKKRIKNGKFTFRYPFILREEDVKFIDTTINNRLKSEYKEYKISFKASVEFENNEKFIYSGLNELFELINENKVLRINLYWTFTIDEIYNGMILQVDYDIIICYEIEQDSDQKEKFSLEEWGVVHVEGSDQDWINGTLKDIKPLITATKMPFWWYYPKRALLFIREYLSIWVWLVILTMFSMFISPLFLDSNHRDQQFINNIKTVTDVTEKLQKYIEYSLSPKTNALQFILIYAFTFGVCGVLHIVITKASRFIFPSSAILIGSNKQKEKNKLIAYSFVWGAIICSFIGLAFTLILT